MATNLAEEPLAKAAVQSKLAGVKPASIFLVEDEAIIRMMLSEMMYDLGHVVVAEAGSLAAARPLAETAEFDLAILDINIDGFNIQPIAEIIERRGLPFLFVSGYGAAGLPETFRDRPVLDKPCSFQNLKQSVDLLLHS